MLFYISCVPPWEEYITDNRSGPGTDLLPRRGFTFLPVMRPSGIRLIHSTFKCQFSRNPHVPTVFGRLSGLCVSASLESHLTVSWCITLGQAMLILSLLSQLAILPGVQVHNRTNMYKPFSILCRYCRHSITSRRHQQASVIDGHDM
jgi:hypothetical protein